MANIQLRTTAGAERADVRDVFGRIFGRQIFDSIADLQAATVNADISTVWLAGARTPGDAGPPMMCKRTNAPIRVHKGWVRSTDRNKLDGTTDSANGGYWEYVSNNETIRFQWFGGNLDLHIPTTPVNGNPGFTVNPSPTDNYQPLMDAIQYRYSNGSTWSVWGIGQELWVGDHGTYTDSGSADSDGGTGAGHFVENTGNSVHDIYSGAAWGVTSGQVIDLTIKYKPAGRTLVKFGLPLGGGTTGIEFNCSGSGTVGTADTGYSGGTITALSGGWYRLAITFTASGTETRYPVLFLQPSAGTVVYTGDGTSGGYVYDPTGTTGGVTYSNSNVLYQQGFAAGLVVELGYGAGYISQKPVPDRSTTIRGTTSAYLKDSAGTRLYYPAGTSAIELNTVGPGGNILRLENILFEALGQSGTADDHGIILNGMAEIVNCCVRGFNGDGVHLSADPPYEIADMTCLHRVWCDVNAGHGFYFRGGDANVVKVDQCSATSNGGWGYRDESFLGLVLDTCHEAYNALGAYYLVGLTSPSVAIGCYSEGGGGQSYFGPTVTVIGGTHSAGYTGVDGSGGLFIQGRRHIGGFECFTDTAQDWFLINEIADSPFGFKHGVNGLPIRWRNLGSYWGYQWAGAVSHTVITSDTYYFTGGRPGPAPIEPTYTVGLGGIFLGQSNGTSCRNITFGSAAPTTGAFAKGEFIFNDGTAADTVLGWKCTATGFLGVGAWSSGTSYFAPDQVKAANGHWYQARSNGTSTVQPTHTASIGQEVTESDGMTWRHLGTGDAVWQGVQITLV